jgi:hypothetical protein
MIGYVTETIVERIPLLASRPSGVMTVSERPIWRHRRIVRHPDRGREMGNQSTEGHGE